MKKRTKSVLLFLLLVFSVWPIAAYPKILCLVFLMAAIIVALILAVRIFSNIRYQKTSYYASTHLPQSVMLRDKGRRGEYEVYERLKSWETVGAKFLFNLYIPKNDGTTTEIDVLMLTEKGIFVFESKNYGGWIFGDEDREQWCQTLPRGRSGKWSRRRSSQKEYFYNPVQQNKGHIKHLATMLGDGIPFIPVVVFSDRCELKNVSVQRMPVVLMSGLADAVVDLYNDRPFPSQGLDIEKIYAYLYPYTQVDEQTKQQHILNIRNGNIPTATPITQKAPSAPAVSTPPPPVPTEPEPPTPAPTEAAAVVSAPEVVPEKVAESATPAVSPPPPRCPLCGGDLVLRTATRGANAGNRFFGCSNFPKCRYIQNIPNA